MQLLISKHSFTRRSQNSTNKDLSDDVLHFAAEGGNVELVRELVGRGCDMNEKDRLRSKSHPKSFVGDLLQYTCSLLQYNHSCIIFMLHFY